MRAKSLLIICFVLLAFALTMPRAIAAEAISLEINKGRMVHLPIDAATVMVADPTIADIQVVSPRLIYLHAKKVGETSLYAIDHHDETILDTTVSVTHNISKLEKAVKQVVPDADVTFKTVDGGLVISGYADSTEESENIRSLAATFLGKDEKLVNLVTTAGSDQVLLMVKVAEVDRNELKQFGINISSVLNPMAGKFAFQALTGRTFYDPSVLGTTGPVPLAELATTQGAVTQASAANGLFGAYNSKSYSIGGMIDALETQGLVSTLAEPSLTTTSGKTANFLAGGEFPIPIVDSQGQVNVEYKPYGVSLNFTPIVLSKDKISLTVAPEVSEISSTNSLNLGGNTTFVIPSIATRRAETSVELGSGQTFAIAGLLENDRENNISKFPGLGDLPILGTLFRSHQFQNNQTELVIMVTPFIARPVSHREKTHSPLDGYTPPTDLQRLLLGKLYQEQDPVSQGNKNENNSGNDAPQAVDRNRTPAPTLYGDGGFILE